MPQQQFVCVLAGWLDKQRNSWPRRWQRRYFAVVAERASRVAVMYYYARGPAAGNLSACPPLAVAVWHPPRAIL